MYRRNRITPRTDIPDWRDENMPVYRLSRPNNNEPWVHRLFPADVVHQYYIDKMNSPFYAPPLWHSDPTYNMRRKK